MEEIKMKKNYTHPEIAMTELDVLDVITASALDKLDPIDAVPGGSDPSMEDSID